MERKGNLLPGRKWRDLLGRTVSVGVNSGVVDGTQCEILALSVQGISPVKEKPLGLCCQTTCQVKL